jgi:hypothetical protein
MTLGTFRTTMKAAAAAGALAFAGALSTDAQAQPLEPPAVYITTASPYYYEGHAVYWYNNRWGWREPHGGGWHWYEHEPQALHEHRVHAPPARYHYEHRR